MASVSRFLIDTSAEARFAAAPVQEALRPVISAGLAATWAGLDAEAIYSARRADEGARVRQLRLDTFDQLAVDDDHWRRALDARCSLAESGRHRAVGIIDLLTAVIAAEHGLTVLHYDSDFELAAEVIDFEHRWVAPRGTL